MFKKYSPLWLLVFLSALLQYSSAQVMYGPTVANSLVGGVISGPNAFPPQADTLVMTSTVSNSANVWTVVLQQSPTTTGPWTNCLSQTVTGGSNTATVTSKCNPQGSNFWRINVTGGAPLALTLVNSSGIPFTLSAPRGVTFDHTHNITYISDAGNNRVLAYNQSTGITTDLDIATLLGSALSNPGQLTDVSDTNIYIADTGNNRIVNYNISANTASVMSVGTPGGLALSSPDGVTGGASVLYFADTGNNRLIDFISGTAGVVNLGAGVTLSSPHGLGIDPSGNVYIADSGNNRLLEYNATSGVTTPIATTGYPLSGPLGATYYNASTPADLVTDSGHNRALQIVAGTTTPLENLNVPGGLTLNDPNQIYVISVVGFSNLLIADTGNNRIIGIQFPSTGGTVSVAVVGINSLVGGGGGGTPFTCDAANDCFALDANNTVTGTNEFTGPNAFTIAQIDALYDQPASPGTAGQFLGNTGGITKWTSGVPTVIGSPQPNVLPMFLNNTSDILEVSNESEGTAGGSPSFNTALTQFCAAGGNCFSYTFGAWHVGTGGTDETGDILAGEIDATLMVPQTLRPLKLNDSSNASGAANNILCNTGSPNGAVSWDTPLACQLPALNTPNSYGSTSPQTSYAWNLQNLSAGPNTMYFNDFYTATDMLIAAIGSATGQQCAINSTVMDVNHPGNLLIQTGTGGTGTGAECSTNSTNTTVPSIFTAPGWTYESLINIAVLPGTQAGAYQVGFATTKNVNPWTTGVGFYLSSANGTVNNWYCENGSTYTNSTTLAVASTWTRLTMISDGTNLHYYINGTLQSACTVAVSTLPTSNQYMAYTSTALSANNLSMYVDYLNFFRPVTR